jgi:hypothetical protein
MSSLRLLLSGSLVASGLVLGAFTLHGAFDPQGPQKQAAGRSEPAREPKGVSAFQTRTHFTGSEKGAEDTAPRAARAGARPEAKPADTMTAEEKAARAAAARRKLAEKRRAERAEQEKAAKAKQEPPPQQATLAWPWNWNWFGN